LKQQIHSFTAGCGACDPIAGALEKHISPPRVLNRRQAFVSLARTSIFA